MYLTKTGVKHTFDEALDAARLKRIERYVASLEQEANNVHPIHPDLRTFPPSLGK